AKKLAESSQATIKEQKKAIDKPEFKMILNFVPASVATLLREFVEKLSYSSDGDLAFLSTNVSLTTMKTVLNDLQNNAGGFPGGFPGGGPPGGFRGGGGGGFPGGFGGRGG